MIYTINNCIRAFGYTNFDNLIADMGSIDGLKEYVIANGYADIAVAEDTELLLVDTDGKTSHTGCYGAVIGPPKPYLCFTSTGDSTVAMHQEGTPDASAGKVIQYKLNDGQWQTWDLSEVSLHDGDKMYLKSDDEIPMGEYLTHKRFVMNGSIAASGNIMSLLNFSDTLPDYAFRFLFAYHCTALTAAPELPATTLSAYCYSGMFEECTSLVQAPALPATTLAIECYNSMFGRCTSLTTAPALPATTLQVECYMSMFSYCTSLTQAPELPATELIYGCYKYMFDGCSKLNYVKALFTTDPTSGEYLDSWLNNVSSTGTFIKSKDATWTNEQAGIPTGWTVQVEGGVTPEPEPGQDYLCFTSTGDSTVAMTQNGTPNKSANKVIQYKLNDGEWQNWDLSTVTLADGDKMYVKSDDTIPMSESNPICKQFVMTGSIAASGNIMSLLNFSDTLTNYAFLCLFSNCSSLTTAPELPATVLTENCYKSMFEGCTSLTTAPVLPATTLVYSCYNYMFYNCTSLTQAPELHATTLELNCYFGMFQFCTNLNYVKAMFTTNPSDGSYIRSWLTGVSETGTFVKNAAATWTNEDAGIPTGWTVQTASPDK